MSEVYLVVEGPTEQRFVETLLAPWLGHQGVYVSASRVGKPGHKGGNVYAIAKRDILSFLKQRPDTLVSCMFDFYGMGNDWPGRNEAGEKLHDLKPTTVEAALLTDIASDGPHRTRARFIPYIQMHEFEALLFAYPPSLAYALGNSSASEEFQEIRDGFQSPEHINDNPNTAPSKRILQVFFEHDSNYQKVLHGSIAAAQVTVERMIGECPHFQTWIEALLATGHR